MYYCGLRSATLSVCVCVCESFCVLKKKKHEVKMVKTFVKDCRRVRALGIAAKNCGQKAKKLEYIRIFEQTSRKKVNDKKSVCVPQTMTD